MAVTVAGVDRAVPLTVAITAIAVAEADVPVALVRVAAGAVVEVIDKRRY